MVSAAIMPAKKYTGPLAIPQITDGQLAERAAMVRIVHERVKYEVVDANSFRSRSVGLWWMNMPTDLRGASFLWEPAWERAVDPGELVTAKTVATLHTFGYHGLFKPSVAEVLAFAPDDLHEFAAFSIAGPETAGDLNVNLEALNAGFQVAEVTYYRLASRE